MTIVEGEGHRATRLDDPVKESKTELIMRAALSTYLEHGPVAPEQIAKRAGVGTTTVYRSVGTKEAVYDALLDWCWHRITEHLMSANFVVDFANTDLSAAGQILADVHLLLDAHYVGSTELSDCLQYIMETMSRPQHLSSPDYFSEPQRLFERRLGAAAEQVVIDHQLAIEPPDLVVAVFTVIRSAIALWITPGGKTMMSPDQAVDRLRLMLEGKDGTIHGDRQPSPVPGSPALA